MSIVWRLLLILLISALALEFVLQIGAVFVAMSYAPDEPQRTSDRAVLCVGDSYTFGIGASHSSANYPSQTEVALRNAGLEEVAVINGGYAGRNSSDVLAVLDHLLERNQPRAVCVLIGTNDQWRAATRYVDTPPKQVDDTGFVWRWRTKRLLVWAFGNRGETEYAHVQAANEAAGATEPSKPKVRPRPERRPSGFISTAPGRKMLTDGDPEGAIQYCREAIELEATNTPMFYDLLAWASIEAGDHASARQAVDELQALYDANPTDQIVGSLAMAIQRLGDADQSLEFCQDAVQRHPESPNLWWLLCQHHTIQRNLEEAERAAQKYFELTDGQTSRMRGAVYRNLFKVWREHDVDKAIRFAALALSEGSPQPSVETLLRLSLFSQVTMERAVKAVEGLELSDEHRAALAESFTRVYGGGGDRMIDVYAENLAVIIRKVKRAGAVPVVVTYPMDIPLIRAAQIRVAAAEQARLVDLTAHFLGLQKGMPPKEYFETYFVADGHCNDLGYRIMGELVAAELRKVLGD